MAVGSITVTTSFRAPDGQVIAMGHGRTSGETDVIRPGDIGMNRIKSIVFQPWGDPRTAFRRLIFIQGSIGSHRLPHRGEQVTMEGWQAVRAGISSCEQGQQISLVLA